MANDTLPETFQNPLNPIKIRTFTEGVEDNTGGIPGTPVGCNNVVVFSDTTGTMGDSGVNIADLATVESVELIASCFADYAPLSDVDSLSLTVNELLNADIYNKVGKPIGCFNAGNFTTYDSSTGVLVDSGIALSSLSQTTHSHTLLDSATSTNVLGTLVLRNADTGGIAVESITTKSADIGDLNVTSSATAPTPIVVTDHGGSDPLVPISQWTNVAGQEKIGFYRDGTVKAAKLVGDGSDITNINAANIVGNINGVTSGTSDNQPNTLVLRDAAGSFNAQDVCAVHLIGEGSGISCLNPANINGVVPNNKTTGNTLPAADSLVLRDGSGNINGTCVIGTCLVGNGTGITCIPSSSITGIINHSNLCTNINSIGNTLVLRSFSGSFGGNVITATSFIGGTLSGNGAGITNICASNITGVIPNTKTTGTPNNIPNTLVQRDCSGNFSAGTINAATLVGNGYGIVSLNPNNINGIVPNSKTTGTSSSDPNTLVLRDPEGDIEVHDLYAASFHGNGSTLTNLDASCIATGIIANARTTGTPESTPNTLVLRDAGCNFDGNTITATKFVGDGSELTNINACNINIGIFPNTSTTATPENVPNAIVARDASGGFCAGVIEADGFVGDGSNITNLNASYVTCGTLSNIHTTGISTNAGNTLVLRDSSCSFSAGTVTATNLVGNGSGISQLNANNITSGKIANEYTTGTNCNNPNTLVLRDACGDFAANCVTAAKFIGSGACLADINADKVTTGIIANDRTTGNVEACANTLVLRDINGSITGNTINAAYFVGNGSGISSLNANCIGSGTIKNSYTTGTASNVPSTLMMRDACCAVSVGTLNAATLVGSGASITDICATNITSGIVPNERLNACVNSIADTLVLRDANGSASFGSVTVSGDITGAGSNLTCLNASNIGSGTIANDRTTGKVEACANTLVLRDANGSFCAGTINAGSFVGSGSSLSNLNACCINSGKIPNTNTTGCSTNTANTLVLRDGNGDFSSHFITATKFIGDGSGLTGLSTGSTVTNADLITEGTLANERTTGSATSLPNTLVLRDENADLYACNIIAEGEFCGTGSGLTNLNALAIDGTIPNANTTATIANCANTIVLRGSDNSITVGPITAVGYVSACGFMGSGSNIIDLNASNIRGGKINNVYTSGTSENTHNTLVLRDADGGFYAGSIHAEELSGSGSNITALNANCITVGILANERTTASPLSSLNTIVARDGSGNFAANCITANGSLLTNINADNITTGVVKNVYTTGCSANVANSLVLRDCSGNFSGNVISGTSFAGNGASLTSLKATSITSGQLANERTTGTAENNPNTLVLRDNTSSFSAQTVTADMFSGCGTNLTKLNASQLTTGLVHNARTTGTPLANACTLVLRDANGSFSGNEVCATYFVGDASRLTNLPLIEGTATTNASCLTSGQLLNCLTTGTASNTPDTLVLRDSGGNFASCCITAAKFIGDGSLLCNIPLSEGTVTTNASCLVTGLLLNCLTTGTASNTPGTLVLRDGTGNFNAQIITAEGGFVGNGSGLSCLDATNIVAGKLFNDRLNACTLNSADTVVLRNTTGDIDVHNITAVNLAGNGASVTNINACNITTGIVANDRLNATCLDTPDTLVRRGPSGEFSAGAITGTSFTGNGAALTALNGSNITCGKVANDYLNASCTATASTLVLRDLNGGIQGEAITGTSFVGNGASLTSLNGSAITTGNIDTARLNATTSQFGSGKIVVRDNFANICGNVIYGTCFSGSGALLYNLNAGCISSGTIANTRLNATPFNTGDKLVLRDANGNFNACCITGAYFSGDGSLLTGLCATNITSGVLANTLLDASSANDINKLVLRDASGNFCAGAITATSFSGLGSGLTGLNASNITDGTIDNCRLNASSSNSINSLVLRDSFGNFTGCCITATKFFGDGGGLTNLPMVEGTVTTNASCLTSGLLCNNLTSGTSLNTPQTLVLRDDYGSFNAQDVCSVGGFYGNGAGLTALNATNITSGKIDNLRTTACSTNSGSAIVARDASGNFSAGVITATSFIGNGSGLSSLNASCITSGALSNLRTSGCTCSYPNTLVLRDAGCNFSAGTITALCYLGNGDGLTNLNGSKITSGTICNNYLNACSSNGYNTLVLRDGLGNFSAGTVNAASFVGNGQYIHSLNASCVSSGTLDNARLNASSSNSICSLVLRDPFGNFTGCCINASYFIGDGSCLTGLPTTKTTSASDLTIGTLLNCLTTGTSLSLPNTLVLRDEACSFSAGTVTAGSFVGAGSGISSLNASNISSGTICNTYTTGSAVTTPNTLVMRDTTCSFAAKTITATTFCGNGSNIAGLNASNIGSGTISNCYTSGTSASNACTLVLRDASGNFAANQITAALFVGSGASLISLNATNIGSGKIGNCYTTGCTSSTASTLALRDASGGFSVGYLNTGCLCLTSSSAINAPTAGTKMCIGTNVELVLPTRASQPTSASAGQVIYNTATSTMQVYNGTSWVNVGATSDIPSPAGCANGLVLQTYNGGWCIGVLTLV
jgi:hypothetical protein